MFSLRYKNDDTSGDDNNDDVKFLGFNLCTSLDLSLLKSTSRTKNLILQTLLKHRAMLP